MTTYNYADVRGHKMFYREAGEKSAPTIVLRDLRARLDRIYPERKRHRTEAHGVRGVAQPQRN